LDLLNKQMDRNDDHHLLRLKDTFIHRQHLCLVFELLSVNLYELIKQNQFRGLSTTLVRVFAQQLLTGLNLLGRAKLIHCDLKPENILLKKYVRSYPTYERKLLIREQSREPNHQNHRFWLRLRRTANSLHLHPIALLPIS
jgi:dual specificity protein kinase YAK1